MTSESEMVYSYFVLQTPLWVQPGVADVQTIVHGHPKRTYVGPSAVGEVCEVILVKGGIGSVKSPRVAVLLLQEAGELDLVEVMNGR